MVGTFPGIELPDLPNIIEDNGDMTIPWWWLASGTGGRPNDEIE